MVKNAGYCENQGYGFVKNIYEKYKINIAVKNLADYPPSGSYFYNLKYKYDPDYLILLNITQNNFLNQYDNSYKILINENNCFFVKKR
tara:strand:+ start:267 stop:530 length:264 start_codon:yes stop_codon:yes gene_type:complete